MPPIDPLQPLLEDLTGALSQEKLERLARKFDSVAQDQPDSLPFFVMHAVCLRMTGALEGHAVTAEKFEEVTAEIAQHMRYVVSGLRGGNYEIPELEQLVTTMYRNLGLFRA